MKKSFGTRFGFFLAVVAILFSGPLAVWAQEGAAPAAAPAAAANDPDVEGFKLFRDNGSDEPGEEVSFFKPSDQKMHFLVTFKSMKFGSTKGKWVFTALETSTGDAGKVAEAEVTALVANRFTGVLSLPREWPYGKYKAELSVNDKLVCTIPYVVTLPIEEVKITEHKLFRDDGKGGQGEEVKTFKPTDHNKHFSVRGNGLFPAGTRVKWVFTAVDTPEGKDQVITDVPLTIDEGSANGDVLSANLELPNDWPLGKYKADVSINEKAAYTVEYEVKAE